MFSIPGLLLVAFPAGVVFGKPGRAPEKGCAAKVAAAAGGATEVEEVEEGVAPA